MYPVANRPVSLHPLRCLLIYKKLLIASPDGKVNFARKSCAILNLPQRFCSSKNFYTSAKFLINRIKTVAFSLFTKFVNLVIHKFNA